VVTKRIIDLILAAQRDGLSGTALLDPQSGRHLHLKKHWVMAELRRLKKQFLNLNKIRTSIDATKIATLFVEYINANQ
jgi:protein KTI12